MVNCRDCSRFLLPKLRVASSNLVARSNKIKDLRLLHIVLRHSSGTEFPCDAVKKISENLDVVLRHAVAGVDEVCRARSWRGALERVRIDRQN